jgi:6-phosphogluconolactonase (cycloisomerase 2 family)
MKRFNRLFDPVIFSLLALLVTGCAGLPDRQNVTSPTSPAVQQNAFLYVGNRDSGDVSGFRVNSDGTLAVLNHSPFSIPPAISASGRQLFASGSGTVGAFSIDANTGSLTHLRDTAIPGGGPVIAAYNANVYVNGTDAAGNFAIYGFSHSSADGTLAPLSGSPFFCGNSTDACNQPISMAIHKQLLMVGGGDNHSFAGNITAYPRQRNGELNPRNNAPGAASTSIAIHPDGKLVYGVDVDQGQGTLLQLLIAPDGTITGTMSLYWIDQDGSYNALAIDPSGKYLVILEETTAFATRLKVFTIDETSGNLTAVGSPLVTGGVGGNFVAFGPTGATVYVVHGGGTNPSNDLSAFSFDHGSGALTKIQSLPTGGTAPQKLSIALP